MGFLSRLSASATPAVNAAGTVTTWAADDDRWYGNEPGMLSNSGRFVTPDLSMKFSAVYHCVNLRAKTVASLPCMMMEMDEKGNSKEAPNHPLNDLLQYQPNKWQTAWDFWAMMVMHLSLRGNAYAEIIAGPRGFADRLEPIHPDRVVVERLIDGTIRYRVSGGTNGYGGLDQSQQRSRILLQDEVLHIRSGIAPGLVGISPITYARETVGLALAAEEFGARSFSNGARPSGVVQVTKRMSDAAFDRFKSEWRNLYNGVSNSGSTPILEEGAEFKPISMTADEAQFLATREFQIEEIARWFDVPPVMLHHSTKATSWGTGVEAIMLAFVRNSVNPLLRCITQAVRRDLILAPRRYSARFDIESLIRGDSKAQAEFFSRLTLNGILTRNEARHELGYNPLDGLDEPLTPTNTTTSDNMPGNGGNEPPKATANGPENIE